jgi:hypothetical protein
MNMSTGKITTLLAATALLVPAGLSAQGHASHHPGTDGPPSTRGMMGQQSGMRSMMSQQMGMQMMQPGPRMLLARRDALQLSDGQVEQLEQLQARADEMRSTHRSEMASVRERLAALRGQDELDLDRYESLLREQADLRVEMQVGMAELGRDALAVLDEEQRSNVRIGMRMMQSMHSGGGMMGGMSDGRSGMKDMMGGMDRPQMMGMMQRMHRQMHGQDCPVRPPQDTESEG